MADKPIPRQVCTSCSLPFDLIRSDFGPVTAYGEFWRVGNCAHCGEKQKGVSLEGPRQAMADQLCSKGGACCWHSTGRTLAVDPPLAVEVCCRCGAQRYLSIRYPRENPQGHGPFHPSRSHPPAEESSR